VTLFFLGGILRQSVFTRQLGHDRSIGHSLVVDAAGSLAFLRACNLAIGRTIKKKTAAATISKLTIVFNSTDWCGVWGIRNPAACHGQVPGHSCLSGDICKKCCWDANGNRYETAKTTVVSLSGMIRFVKTAVFSGGQQLFFIRKMVTSGRFNC
jgi:hypothetical protein